jgi:hypothetical protein
MPDTSPFARHAPADESVVELPGHRRHFVIRNHAEHPRWPGRKCGRGQRRGLPQAASAREGSDNKSVGCRFESEGPTHMLLSDQAEEAELTGSLDKVSGGRSGFFLGSMGPRIRGRKSVFVCRRRVGAGAPATGRFINYLPRSALCS